MLVTLRATVVLRVDADRLAVDFLPVDFFAVDRFAVDRLAGLALLADFLVVFFFAADFFAMNILLRIGVCHITNRGECRKELRVFDRFGFATPQAAGQSHSRFSRCCWMSPALWKRLRIRESFNPRTMSFTTLGCLEYLSRPPVIVWNTCTRLRTSL